MNKRRHNLKIPRAHHNSKRSFWRHSALRTLLLYLPYLVLISFSGKEVFAQTPAAQPPHTGLRVSLQAMERFETIIPALDGEAASYSVSHGGDSQLYLPPLDISAEIHELNGGPTFVCHTQTHSIDFRCSEDPLSSTTSPISLELFGTEGRYFLAATFSSSSQKTSADYSISIYRTEQSRRTMLLASALQLNLTQRATDSFSRSAASVQTPPVSFNATGTTANTEEVPPCPGVDPKNPPETNTPVPSQTHKGTDSVATPQSSGCELKACRLLSSGILLTENETEIRSSAAMSIGDASGTVMQKSDCVEGSPDSCLFRGDASFQQLKCPVSSWQLDECTPRIIKSNMWTKTCGDSSPPECPPRPALYEQDTACRARCWRWRKNSQGSFKKAYNCESSATVSQQSEDLPCVKRDGETETHGYRIDRECQQKLSDGTCPGSCYFVHADPKRHCEETRTHGHCQNEETPTSVSPTPALTSSPSPSTLFSPSPSPLPRPSIGQ